MDDRNSIEQIRKAKEEPVSEITLMVPNLTEGYIIAKSEYKPTNSDEFNIWLNTLSEQRFSRFMRHMKSIGESKSV